MPLQPFPVVEVLRTAAGLGARHARLFLAVALIGTVPVWIVLTLTAPFFELPAPATDEPFPNAAARSALAVMLLRALVLSLCTYWASGVAAYFVVRTLRGTAPTLLAAVQQASRRIGYVLVASFLMSLLVTLGFLLMVVPGAALWLMFWVATPAAIVEGRFASALRRSYALTDGHKWELLGLLAVLLLVSLPPAMGITIAIGTTIPVALPIVGAFVQVALWTLWGAVSAVSYYRLRTLAEGGAE